MRTPLDAGTAGAVLAGLALVTITASPAAVAAPAPTATTPRDVAYVVSTSGASMIDLQSATTTRIAGVGPPSAVATRPDGSMVFIATASGVKEIPTSTGRVLTTLAIGDATGLAVSPNGSQLYSAMWTSDTVGVSPTGGNGIVRITGIPDPYAVALTPDGRYLYVTDTDGSTPEGGSDMVTVVDTNSRTVAGTIQVPAIPWAIAASPDGGRMYVLGQYGTLIAIDTATRSVLYVVPVAGDSGDLVPSPDGRWLYVSDNEGVEIIDPGTGAVADTLAITSTVRGLALSPDGDLYVVAQGGDRISRIDTTTNSLRSAEFDILTPGSGAYDLVVADVPYIAGPVAGLSVQPDEPGSKVVTASAAQSVREFAPIVSYRFDFGDGTVVALATQTASHAYAGAGTYLVTLTVTDNLGQTGQTSAAVTIEPSPPVPTRTTALLASNLRYLTAENAGASPAVANRTQIGLWETIDIVDAGGGAFVVRSHANSDYLRVDQAHGAVLIADATTADTATKFLVESGASGQISLRDQATGRYVSGNNGSGPATADRTVAGPWEWFYQADLADGVSHFRAQVNGMLVTAESAGAKPLIANRSAAGLWEQFDLISLGGSAVALFSHADGRFVTAENAGNSPLIANRTVVGAWETFTLQWYPDHTFSLLALANDRYVTAENAGRSALIANRTQVGLWETFSP